MAGKAKVGESRGMTPMSYQILLALAGGELHGYGIIKDIEARSGAGTVPSTGAMYLALQRLEESGLIEGAARRGAEEDARRRYYRLTEPGRQRAVEETTRLAQLVGAAHERRLIGTRLLSKLVPGGGHGR
jgi:DNA-binding PadR family transcriptional regulator